MSASAGIAVTDLDSCATELLSCERQRRERGPVTQEWSGLDQATAYSVQDEVLRRKVDEGERLIGVKLGLTSRAKQQRMNVHAPLTGWLTDAMVLPAGVPIPQDELIHPRAEPEIVFVLGDDLVGPGVTAASAMAAVDMVYAGLEIIDSRYADFKFTLPDVIADNASSARFILGGVGRRPQDLDLMLEACLLEVNGAIVDSATGAAVQGHPAEALALAANDLATRGLSLKAGWIVLTGGMTDAVFITPGTNVAAHFTNLGAISVRG
ncbi:MAG: 2-keto-4-pentenoate hydratase [Actinomycetales bacterium]